MPYAKISQAFSLLSIYYNESSIENIFSYTHHGFHKLHPWNTIRSFCQTQVRCVKRNQVYAPWTPQAPSMENNRVVLSNSGKMSEANSKIIRNHKNQRQKNQRTKRVETKVSNKKSEYLINYEIPAQ